MFSFVGTVHNWYFGKSSISILIFSPKEPSSTHNDIISQITMMCPLPKAFWVYKSTASFTNIMFPSQSDLDRWCTFVSYQLSQTITCCFHQAGEWNCWPCLVGNKVSSLTSKQTPSLPWRVKACEPDIQRSFD